MNDNNFVLSSASIRAEAAYDLRRGRMVKVDIVQWGGHAYACGYGRYAIGVFGRTNVGGHVRGGR